MVQVLLWLPANTALTSTDNFLPREKCILAGTQCGRHVKQDQCCSENKDLTGWEVIRGIMEASEERCYLSRVLQDYTARLAVLGREHSRAGNSSTMGSGSRSGAWGAARRLCCRCSVSEQSEDGQQAPECLLHYFNNLGFFLSEMGSFFEISEKRVMIWFILKKKKDYSDGFVENTVERHRQKEQQTQEAAALTQAETLVVQAMMVMVGWGKHCKWNTFLDTLW